MNKCSHAAGSAKDGDKSHSSAIFRSAQNDALEKGND
jgi:hypothetical protein